jgi:glycosyltransferase involved in cell wall biosynthesis
MHDNMLRYATGVVAVSQKQVQEAPQALMPRIRLIENPISLNEKDVCPPGAFEGDRLRLLFLGRLSEEKGLQDLLQGLQKARLRVPVHLDVVGDGPLRSTLEKRAAGNTGSTSVRFWGHQRDIVPFLQKSHAVVMPSHREGMPMSALEALAFGRPLLASEVGGLPDLVKTGQNGWLLPPRDSQAWAAAFSTLPEKMAHLGEGAWVHRRRIWDRFGPGVWAQKTVHHYEEVQHHERNLGHIRR